MTPYQFGQRLALQTEKTAFLAAALPWLMAAGKAMLPSLATGAVLGGGIGALTAQPGQRMQGALSGAGYGALTGGAAKGLSMGLRGVAGNGTGGLLNTPAVKGWMDKPGQGFLGKATRWGVNKGSGEMGMGLATAPLFPSPGGNKPDPMPMTNIPGYY